jgi:hypothetical protein
MNDNCDDPLSSTSAAAAAAASELESTTTVPVPVPVPELVPVPDPLTVGGASLSPGRPAAAAASESDSAAATSFAEIATQLGVESIQEVYEHLFAACEQGSVDVLQWIIGTFNGKFKHIWKIVDSLDTSLVLYVIQHCAESNAACEMIRLLHSQGADLDQCNHKGVSPMFAAILQRRFGIVWTLIQLGANLDATAPGNHFLKMDGLEAAGKTDDTKENAYPLMSIAAMSMADCVVALMVEYGASTAFSHLSPLVHPLIVCVRNAGMLSSYTNQILLNRNVSLPPQDTLDMLHEHYHTIATEPPYTDEAHLMKQKSCRRHLDRLQKAILSPTQVGAYPTLRIPRKWVQHRRFPVLCGIHDGYSRRSASAEHAATSSLSRFASHQLFDLNLVAVILEWDRPTTATSNGMIELEIHAAHKCQYPIDNRSSVQHLSYSYGFL